MLLDRYYGAFGLLISRNGGTDIVGPFRRKLKQFKGEGDYITFKYNDRRFVIMFYVQENPQFFWLTEVQHEHGVRNPAFDTTLGNKLIKSRLIWYKEFRSEFIKILNNSHENQEI